MNLVRQRLHALVLGYADLNDHDTLRHDAGLPTGASSTAALGSPATLCRWEQSRGRLGDGNLYARPTAHLPPCCPHVLPVALPCPSGETVPQPRPLP